MLAISLANACSRCIYNGVILHAHHIPFVVKHTINATPPERLQQHPLLFTTNHTDRTFFLWRLNSARPLHPGHSTILLRSEISSGMCAKLRTVAASNNRDPARNLSACSRYLYNGVILHAHPVRGESHINATPPERLQQLLSRLNLEIFTLHHCAINCWRQK